MPYAKLDLQAARGLANIARLELLGMSLLVLLQSRSASGLLLGTTVERLSKVPLSPAQLLLPRLLDAIMQVLELLSVPDSSEDYGVSAMVLDFAEAFWQAPLHPKERKFFCGKLTIQGIEKFFVFLRMVQGSRSAPLCWARVAALLTRLTRSPFLSTSVRALCYVDDPLFLFASSPAERRRMATMCILTWEG